MKCVNYVAPEIEVVEVAVEDGIAITGSGEPGVPNPFGLPFMN